jgi:hypothetical protein
VVGIDRATAGDENRENRLDVYYNIDETTDIYIILLFLLQLCFYNHDTIRFFLDVKYIIMRKPNKKNTVFYIFYFCS